MTGEPLDVQPQYVALAGTLASMLIAGHAVRERDRTVIAIAGESGSGKSTTATALARELATAGVRAVVLHQDDYFMRPPRANHAHRLADLSSVGPQEVDLDLLLAHIAAFRAGRDDVRAPRVDYPSDSFHTRRLDFANVAVLIIEGTYVLRLDDSDVRIFLDATHADTRARRRARNRDIDDPAIDRILAIEHAIIAEQATAAQIVVDRDFNVRR